MHRPTARSLRSVRRTVTGSSRSKTATATVALLLGTMLLSACASTGIAVREAFGYTKREQLVDRVEEARDGQEDAKEQFESALAEFIAVTGADVGELEARYDDLDREYQRSRKAADEVSDRIADVEAVATRLFDEWNTELAEYSSASLRSASEQQLQETRSRYERLLATMKAAESKMEPVLSAFKDQVLFLKHNLNAQAIASLGTTVNQIQGDVDRLIAEMNAAIAESNRFIDEMGSPSSS